MRHLPRSFLLLCCLAILAGCSSAADDAIPRSARSVLEHADSFELLSLKPRGVADDDESWKKDPREKFRWWGIVLGKIQIKSDADRSEMLAAVGRQINPKSPAFHCFNPRHAIHAVRGADSVDIVICFECGRIQTWLNNERIAQGNIHGPRSTLDKPLSDAGVELSRPEEAETK